MRVTVDQNLVLRWVPVGEVRELYRRLAAASLGLADAATIADVGSCPGAECCRLAVTQSRGLGRLLGDTLRARPDLIAKADGAQIKISGCPNGCGQHHIATIGFQGSVRKVGGRAVPQYFVMLGGGTAGEVATFARIAAKVPARRIPRGRRTAGRSVCHREAGRGVGDRLLPAPRDPARQDVTRRSRAADAERTPSQIDFIDLAESGEFTPEVMEGECSA